MTDLVGIENKFTESEKEVLNKKNYSLDQTVQEIDECLQFKPVLL
jgi:hypothetical protein